MTAPAATLRASSQARIQMFGAWCGVYYVAVLLSGWAAIAGFLPPHRPYADAESIAAIFAADRLRIRIGMVIVMFGAMFLIPFTAVIGQFLAKIEGRPGVLTYSALLGGAGTMILTFYPAIWWLVAGFRPERPADLVFVFNDMAWLQLIGGVSLFFALPGSLAVAAFADESDMPVFPRWSGFVNIWVMIIIVPDQLLFFFHSGPFSWNGLFGFWLPLVVFAGWFFVIFHLLRKAILRQRNDAGNKAAMAPQAAAVIRA